MSFIPNLQIINIFKRNTEKIKEKVNSAQQQQQETPEVEAKDYYKHIRVSKDDGDKIVRSSKDVSDKDVHFFVNQYNKILEIKDIKLLASVENTILVKYNADLTKDHSKRVMERLLRNLRQEFGIEEKEVKYEENDDEKIIIEKRNFFSKSHFETFIQVFQSMQIKSNIFRKVIRQLERSSMYLKLIEIPLGGFDYAIGNKTITENGSFEHHSGIKKDPHIIKLFYDANKKEINGYKEDYTIAEEFIHAGQLDYYGIDNTVSKIDIEVEAKLIKSMEGFRHSLDDISFTLKYYGIDDFKSIFIKSKLTKDNLEKFDAALDWYGGKVSEAYINLKKEKGMTEDQAKLLYGTDVFTKEFKYLEHLYNRKIRYE